MPDGQKQTINRRPDERAAQRSHLHRAKPAGDANDWRRQEDAPAERPTGQGSRSARREGKNYAAQFSAEAARSPKALIAPARCLFSFWSQSPGRDREGTIVHAPSGGARPFRHRCIISSDASKAVRGLPWSRNGLQACRTVSVRDRRGGCSLDQLTGSFQSLQVTFTASLCYPSREAILGDVPCFRNQSPSERLVMHYRMPFPRVIR